MFECVHIYLMLLLVRNNRKWNWRFMVTVWFDETTGLRAAWWLLGKDTNEIQNIFKYKCTCLLCEPLWYVQSGGLETTPNPPNNIRHKKKGKLICELSVYGLSILWHICDKLLKTEDQLLIAIMDTFVMPAYFFLKWMCSPSVNPSKNSWKSG